MSYINIAIDGTSASGKSTVCEVLAKKLNINHLSSGAIYRAIALYLVENKLDYNKYVNNDDNTLNLVQQELKNINIEVKFNNFSQIIYLNNVDVTNLLNTNEISNVSSIISQNKSVRNYVEVIQKKLASTQNIIIDGRDITSKVLKDCKNKFFITASIEARAKRRYLQYNKKIPLKQIEDDLKERDYRDMHRAISPLKIVEDAIVIDSSNLTIDETIDVILKHIIY